MANSWQYFIFLSSHFHSNEFESRFRFSTAGGTFDWCTSLVVVECFGFWVRSICCSFSQEVWTQTVHFCCLELPHLILFIYVFLFCIRYNCGCCILTLQLFVVNLYVHFSFQVHFWKHLCYAWLNFILTWMLLRCEMMICMCPSLRPVCPGWWGVAQTECGWRNIARRPGGSRNRSVFEHQHEFKNWK